MQAREDAQPRGSDKTRRGKRYRRSSGEAEAREGKAKPDSDRVHRIKSTKAPLRYDFIDTRRGPMCVIGTVTSVKSLRKYITLTEWPESLLGAFRAGILSGESEVVARAIAAMSTR
jgi:hypothetical protein